VFAPARAPEASGRCTGALRLIAFVTLVADAVALGPRAQAQTGPAATVVLPQVQVVAPSERPPLTEVTENVEAAPASVTVLTRPDLDRKTIVTYGDIFRGLPGIFVNEYGQGLVAYDIKLRGFASGHGRDVAFFLDGMPLNVSGSQHTNGYADLAQVIPELLDRVEIVRGPFSVLAGNHAVAASVQFTTDARPPSMVKFQADTFGRVRLLPVYNVAVGKGNWLTAVDGTIGPGYTDQSDLWRVNFFTRYSVPLGEGLAAVRFQAYEANADAPGYLDLARIRSGEINLRDALSQGIGDAKSQQNLVFNYRSFDAEGASGWGSGWFVSAYANNDIRKRWTNFDLSLSPGSSAPLNQERDRLHQLGFDVRKTTSFATVGRPSQVLVGVQYNDERVQARNFLTDAARHPLVPSVATAVVVNIDRDVSTITRSFYAEYQLQPVERLKLTAGIRYDRLQFDIGLAPDDGTYATAVAAGLGSNITSTASQWSPKLGVGASLYQGSRFGVELYANYARGLKGPYPFSDFFANLTAPFPVIAASVPNLSISAVRSYEAGLQGASTDGAARWRVSGWNTRQDQEAGRNAAGIYSSFLQTDRDGIDLDGSVLVSPSTRLFANFSRVWARSLDPVTPGADRIPNVPEYIATVGALSSLAFDGQRLDLSGSGTWIGPQPLTPDNSLSAGSYFRYIGRVAYTRSSWKGASVFFSVIGYNKQLEETQFDFGGGVIGVSPRPKLVGIAGIQVPL
jgi:outer membrane receptor protein involved in Fe transport